VREVIVSRHGESVAFARGVSNGDPSADQGLTAVGREQAHKLGGLIVGDAIDLCVSSEFPRTRQTAALALAGRDLECAVDSNLNDIRYGAFEGQAKDRYHTWAREHALSTPIPGGESRADVASRLCAALEMLLGRPQQCALVVTHELLIDDLLRAVRGQLPQRVHPDVPYATPYRLTALDLDHALAFLRDWLRHEEGSAH
jgi:probable phosphoglycerate mutase